MQGVDLTIDEVFPNVSVREGRGTEGGGKKGPLMMDRLYV